MRSRLLCVATIASTTVFAADKVTALAPTITGPIANTVKAPDPAHGYPFNPTFIDLAAKGYVEEEFFIEGTAKAYVSAVKDTTEKNVKAGYILKVDAEATIAAAEKSDIGGR